MSDQKLSMQPGTPITEQEAKEKFPDQFKTLKRASPLDGRESTACAWSDCIRGKQLVMRYDTAGNCTLYEYVDCQ